MIVGGLSTTSKTRYIGSETLRTQPLGNYLTREIHPKESKVQRSSSTHCIASCMSLHQQQRLDHFWLLSMSRVITGHEAMNSPRVNAKASSDDGALYGQVGDDDDDEVEQGPASPSGQRSALEPVERSAMCASDGDGDGDGAGCLAVDDVDGWMMRDYQSQRCRWPGEWPLTDDCDAKLTSPVKSSVSCRKLTTKVSLEQLRSTRMKLQSVTQERCMDPVG
ncbi:uncharacterized protein B0T23DRAFT_433656 [Neurospora hispaniola]|uniref:Uncharacterized protein n=1 Tax=Neurospora hispaniola TaxID=588809 RepID=A0AAJ0IE80_9PEZI|nr:hypothetical protein B0T23DRAFT_433656 [Neurospora hispaniola]